MSKKQQYFNPSSLQPEQKQLLSEANIAKWKTEVRDKIERLKGYLSDGKGVDMLEFWHGPEFWPTFAGKDEAEKEAIATDYATGDDFMRETMMWLGCAAKEPRFSLGLPEGLELEGPELSGPNTVVAEIDHDEANSMFLIRVASGEWYCPW